MYLEEDILEMSLMIMSMMANAISVDTHLKTLMKGEM